MVRSWVEQRNFGMVFPIEALKAGPSPHAIVADIEARRRAVQRNASGAG